MADVATSSSVPSKDDKPVIVRVKRKACQSPLEAFWLEINERPYKRPLLDFEKLSIADSSAKAEELKTKKVFVQHVETVISAEIVVDFLQSFVPNSAEASESKANSLEERRSIKVEKKQDKLLVKARHGQEILSKSARFEQIWRSRKGKKEAIQDAALHEICQLYDVVRVDVEENAKEKQEADMDLEEHRIMSSYLPLLREFIPDAAADVESDIRNYMSKQASKNEYVYDLYAVKDDVNITQDGASSLFPLVQVDNDDEFYDGPAESEYESDDSNAEDNPLNDYPDEEISEGEDDPSQTSNDESEDSDDRHGSNRSWEPEDLESVDADHLVYEDKFYEDEYVDGYSDDYCDDDGEV